jgi:hypothetical protein
MGTLIAALITAPIAAIGIAELQAWLENRDYARPSMTEQVGAGRGRVVGNGRTADRGGGLT